MLLAALGYFEAASFWERAFVLEGTVTGYTDFLIDWRIETYTAFGSIRLLPRKFAKLPPWAYMTNRSKR